MSHVVPNTGKHYGKNYLSPVNFCLARGISVAAFKALLDAKRVFMVPVPGGQPHCPAFFVDQWLDLPAIEALCMALGDLPGADKEQFLTTPRDCLGGKTGLNKLSDTEFALMLAEAVQLGAQVGTGAAIPVL